MTPVQTTTFSAETYDAKVREADAKLNVLKAQAEARKAKADMDEISGLAAFKEQVRKDIAQAKQFAADDRAQTAKDFEKAKKSIDQRVKDLQARIDRASERYTAWDAARERRFNARLDQADAQVKVWKAQADQDRALDKRDAQNALATLQEKVALARASAAEAKREKYTAKSLQALEDAARYFDQAYDAAVVRYETS